VQLPALHDLPPLQTLPQLPQLLSFSATSMQALLQNSRVPAQSQALPLQLRPPLQAMLQAPQCAGLVVRLTQL
jgi:hypothetical protein